MPNETMNVATCVWEAADLATITAFLEGATGDVSKNEYMIINEAHAMGV